MGQFWPVFWGKTNPVLTGSGGAKPPKPPKDPKQPFDDGNTEGCAKAIVFAFVLMVVLFGLALLADDCMLLVPRQTDEERQSSIVASRMSEYEATRSATEATTTEATYTTSYRYTTRYRYTTQEGTTRDDPYDAHGYIDADDFAAENWEEFDDYDEAYDYYEDYMAGYE